MDNKEFNSSIRRPFIFIDSSYVLKDCFKEGVFNKEIFLQRCQHVHGLRKYGARLIQEQKTEIESVLLPFLKDRRLKYEISKLNEIKNNDYFFGVNDYPVFNFLMQRALETGNDLKNTIDGNPLSKKNMIYIAHSLMGSRYRDVIAATQDRMIIHTLSYLYSKAHSVFLEQGYVDSSLFVSEKRQELESIIQQRISKFKLQEMHSSQMNLGWEGYRRRARNVWLKNYNSDK